MCLMQYVFKSVNIVGNVVCSACRDSSACASFVLNEEGKREYILYKTLPHNVKEYELRSQQVCGLHLTPVLPMFQNHLYSNLSNKEMLSGTLHLNTTITTTQQLSPPTTSIIMKNNHMEERHFS